MWSFAEGLLVIIIMVVTGNVKTWAHWVHAF